MQVCDYNLRILSVDATHPGSTHDASIWETSQDRRVMTDLTDNGEESWFLGKLWFTCSFKINKILYFCLGDSGYPLELWLIVQFDNPEEGSAEDRFNVKHRKARNCIERTNGVLKLRYRCLLGERTMRYQPQTAVSFTNVCCALHNICRSRNITDPDLNDPKNQRLLERSNLVLPFAVAVENTLFARGEATRNRLLRHI